jgi:hypothetical protein
MLRNGKFIKEPPIRIGAHYVPPPYKPTSEEEWIIQHLILESKRQRRGISITNIGLALLFAYVIVSACVMMLNFLLDNFLG